MLRHQENILSSESQRLRAALEVEKMRYVNSMSVSAWRAIALMEKENRLDAEQSQRQLRSEVIARARILRQMQTLMQRFNVVESGMRWVSAIVLWCFSGNRTRVTPR
ncbi:hypothetical protein GN244_ATG01703 [Phytophthora infestans]|uniref:Uncharacterized protein n=1 Tax=Phytophthora infestans TaxID=4787 RepID=A0A833STY9_PHYIN|nr:hypothetical protein GN244_ATG01703 [Phytophthora infestans]KAF4133605.1 hypothetical protein GN958_ATG16942 [Phytophthora infestans]